MDVKGKWMIPAAGLAAAIFIIWGFTGEGTAKKLLPEKEPVGTVSSSISGTGETFAEDDGSVMKYDAARFRRGKPLQDPFHAKAIAEAKEDLKKSVSPAVRKPAAKEKVPSVKRRESAAPERKHSDIPQLKGIMAYRDDRRAIIELDGETFVLKEGERAGLWTVSAIQEKKVILQGTLGTLELGTR